MSVKATKTSMTSKSSSIYDECKKELLIDSESELKELQKEQAELSKEIEKKEQEVQKELIFKDQSILDISQINQTLKSMQKKDFKFEHEINYQLNRLTSSKKLISRHKKLSVKVAKAKAVEKLFKKYTGQQLKDDLKIVDAWKLLGSKKASEIKTLLEELDNLEVQWDRWKELKLLIREKTGKKLIVQTLHGRSEAVINTLKDHLRNYEKANSKEKTNIKREIRNMKLFEHKQAKDIDKVLKLLVKELKEHTLEDIKSRFEYLRDFAAKTCKELEECFKEFPALTEIRDFKAEERKPRRVINTRSKVFDKSLSPEESKRWEQASQIAWEFRNFKNSTNVKKIMQAFKVLKGKSPEEIVKELKRVESFKDEVYANKSAILAVVKRLKQKDLQESIKTELSERENDEERMSEQVKEAKKVESDLKSKSPKDIAKEIQELEKLRALISEGADSKVKVSPETLKKWREIQQKAVVKVGDKWKKSSNLKPSGRNSMGVKGISLDFDDSIISVSSTYEGNMVLTIDEEGNGKCTSLEKFRLTGRNTRGVLSCLNQAAYERRKKVKDAKEEVKGDKTVKSSDQTQSGDSSEGKKDNKDNKYFKKLIACTLINNKEDVITLLTEQGFFTRFKASEEIVSVKSGRVTSGAKLIELGSKHGKDDKIKCFAKFKSFEGDNWKLGKDDGSEEEKD